MWTLTGTFLAAVLSAVVPWVNAELVLLSLTAVVASPMETAALVIAMTTGQMTGKSAMYFLSRRAAFAPAPRVAAALDRWRERLRHRPRSAVALVGVSALLGFPPFYLVSIAAGAVRVPFTRFVVAGTVGRFVHFAAIAWLPYAVGRFA